MRDRAFIDSNIWIYAFADEESNKAKIAKQLISDLTNNNTIVISFQVINEVCNILKRKKLTENSIREVIELLSKICLVQVFTKDILLMASKIREVHSFSYWDSLITATALSSECKVLYSEDMQDGRVIDNMRFRNVF